MGATAKDSNKIDGNQKTIDETGSSSMTYKFVETVIKKGKVVVIPIILLSFLLLLLIWDMKSTFELSEIVHDDHSDNWESMNTTLLHHWFSPLDLCMLNISEPNVDIKTYRQTKCGEERGAHGVVSYRLFCGLGSSLGKQCSSPLTTRSFFKSRLIGTLGDPYNNLLKTSLRRLAREQKAVIFVGDAISKQNQEALICELMRTDTITVIGSLHSTLNSTVSKFNIRWKDESDLTLDVIFMHMAHLSHSHHKKSARRKILQNERNISDSSFEELGLNKTTSEERKVNISHEISSNFSYYSPSMTLENAEVHMNFLLPNYTGGSLIIANIGVWYNSRERYRQELPNFLNWLNKIGHSHKNIVMFRETSAQHWNHTVNGYFENEETAIADSSCVPIADSRVDLDWRNRDVKFTIENEEFKNIHIIPFRDVTAPLYNMHPDGSGSKDCTRFCYFPQMWQSVWWQINDVSNRTSLVFNSTRHNT